MLRFALFYSFLLSFPFVAYAQDIPGRIEAEAPSTFYELTPGDILEVGCGWSFLDLELTGDTEGLCNIGWTEPGEWVQYAVHSASGGAFWLSLRVAANRPQRMIEVRAGEQVQTFEIPRKGWQIYSDVVFPIHLPPGKSDVRVTFSNGGVNLNYLDFVEPTTDPSTVWSLPARVEAEHFINSLDSTGEHSGDSICNTGAVDSQITKDVDGFCDIAWTTAGEWTEYVVSSPAAADYELILRTASGKANRKLRVDIDGVDLSGNLVVPRLGWETFSDVKVLISLAKGQHRIRVVHVTGATDLNYLNFKLVPCVGVPGSAGCPVDDDGDGDRIVDDRDICPLEPGLVELRGCASVFGDFDGDGIADPEDLCSYSTPGESPADGCKPIDAADSDNDGVNNDVDLCETVPGGLSSAGCPSFLDTDHDGIRDPLDLCPNDYGVKIQNGCWDGSVSLNSDADGDGVANAQDQCSATSANAAVGPNGCAIQSELEDRDRDGVRNDMDVCPHSNLNQENSGHLVDSQGCTGIQIHRRMDNDNDGVPNGSDLCPGTPSIADADPANSLTLFGCRIGESDDDRDGLPEFLDSCPTEVGHRAYRGCLDAFEQIADGDGDSVPLNVDECPYTPLSASSPVNGCAPIDWEDLDGDGVINGRDLCPASPFGRLVDNGGCNDHDRLDFDGDGVMNGVDLCPRFAGLVRHNGCGLNPVDADADGVEDPFDHCPNTLQPYSCGPDPVDLDEDGFEDWCPVWATINEKGCSVFEDADGDGAWEDSDDECLNTPVTQSATGSPNPWNWRGIGLPIGCSLQQYAKLSDEDLDGVGAAFDLCPSSIADIPVDMHGCPLDSDDDRDGDGVPDINDHCLDSHKGVPLTAGGCEIVSAPRVTQSLHHNLTLANPQLEILTRQVNIEGGSLAPTSQPLVWELGEFAWSDALPIEVEGERLRVEILPLPLRGRDFHIPLRLRVPGTEVVSNWFELVVGENPAYNASVIVTDADVLAASGINLYDTLSLLSGVPEQADSGLELYQQFWDAQRSREESQLGLPIHCDQLTNGFPSGCDAPSLGFGPTVDRYRLTAVVNRLDTNNNWQDCGEHRLLFIFPSREPHYLNFGARLPNLTPGDMRGCRSVVEFWRELPGLSKAEQAQSLRRFFYGALPEGARPAIAPEHFTGSDGSLFSMRSLEQGPFTNSAKLEKICGPACRYWWRVVPSRDTPFGLLFDPVGASQSASYAEIALDFQQWFPEHLNGLFPNNPVVIKSNTAERFNTVGGGGNYLARFGEQHDSEFGIRLQQAVRDQENADGSPLEVEHILARASATTCDGCHGMFDGADSTLNKIGALERADGTILRQWPDGWVHIRDGGKLSPSLRNVYLPGRQVLFDEISDELDALTD
jgi:hypothetical protein